jgi:hypothetical protein
LLQRASLLQQFIDDKTMQFKPAFSIRAVDANNFRTLIGSIGSDLGAANAVPRKPTAGNNASGGDVAAPETAAANAQPTAGQLSQQAPLNPANLEKHTQAMSKVHQRSNSKSGQAPAAPTTTQPPFQLGAQMSPTGQPTYFNKPAVTQETLNPPPPARKKAKTGHGQAASPALSQPVPSPQVKAASPEVRRQPPPQPEQPQAPPPPQFVCPDAQCNMHKTGFPTKEALDAHHYEEHVKPYEDPMKFMEDTLNEVFGLDPPQPNSAAAMKPSGSKQGQTQTLAKPDATSTPMSRTASMGRQSSAQEAKIGTPVTGGKGVPIKNEGTPKLGTKQGLDQPQQPTVQDPWANSTVDPAALQATFAPLQPLINGHFSSFSPHRSYTPNDTPESSKDSGVSEPTSDISERAQLDIAVNWAPVDLDEHSDMLLGMDSFSMAAGDDLFADNGTDFSLLWEELNQEFDKRDQSTKPSELDPSLYSLHCT